MTHHWTTNQQHLLFCCILTTPKIIAIKDADHMCGTSLLNMHTSFTKNRDDYREAGITQASTGNNCSCQILVSPSWVGQTIYALLTHTCVPQCCIIMYTTCHTACNETNLMHCLSSVYSVTIPLHVLGLLVAHHQEVTMYKRDNWYVLYVLVDCQLAWLRWD
jgi:hypothetical protein